MTAYLGLGSNLGDRAGWIQRAFRLLHDDGITLVSVSSLYETGHIGPGGETAPPYLNCVAWVETQLGPTGLLAATQSIEARLGRERPYPNAPRTVDIDILLLDDQVVSLPGLSVPHPRMDGRRFVLEPLAEITPGLRLPDGRGVADLLRSPDVAGQPVRLYRRRASAASIDACEMRMWQD